MVTGETMKHTNRDTLRIVFFGTPELAAFVLEKMIRAGIQVVAAVTAPDRPAGRGRKIRKSPVKITAERNNISVWQPENLKSPEFIRALQAIQPDLQVVVAFRMLPEAVWALPPLGSFNLHASLLPEYRGAAPINWAIIRGEKKTGITTFLLDHKIDTGNILFKEPIPIDDFETAGSLHEKIKVRGAQLVNKTIDALATGAVKPTPQKSAETEDDQLPKAPKIYKEDCRIVWDQPVQQIVNHIHGLSPHPGAFTEVTGENGQTLMMKIFKARPEYNQDTFQPGSILTDNRHFIKIAGNDGLVTVHELQMPGKKRMQVEELLRGMDFSRIKKAH